MDDARQASYYLPEYKATPPRAQAGDFMSLCKTRSWPVR